MSNLSNLTLFLDFVSDGTGIVQIDEHTGFDALIFTTKQDKGRFARDVSFGTSGEKIDITFENQDNLFPSPCPKLFEYDKIYGPESEVKYIIRDNGVDYIMGEADFENKSTDHYNYFKCKVIQDLSRSKIKRRIDTKIDLFSDEDLQGDPIIPVQTSRILLKAKPVIQISEWFTPNQYLFAWTGNPDYGFNGAFGQQETGIEDSLSWLSNNDTSAEDIVLIDAKSNLTNITLEISNLTILGNNGSNIRMYYKISDVYGSSTEVEMYNFGQEVISFTDEITMPDIGLGEKLWVYFKFNNPLFGNLASFESGNIKISSKATAIDSVTEGVRFIDAMKQNAKSIYPLFEVDSERYDQGGEHYDNFIFNGNLIRGRKDDDGNNVPFVLSWKSIDGYLPELNFDWQVKNNSIFVGQEPDFYPGVEIGAFLQAPDSTIDLTYNPKFTINEIVYKYKKFNQDKDDDNTIDGVHTILEFAVPNNRVKNTKKIEVEFIRDPFELETTRKKAVSTKPTTSLSQDDSVFIFDVIPLAPNSTSGFTSVLTHYVNDDGYLQLLNDGTFNWGQLGFGIGDIFLLLNTDNLGNYIVIDITSNIITLSGLGVVPTAIGDVLTQVQYPLTNVQYSIRTDEGFDLIENILAPNEFGNLKYTIKRNILDGYGSHLKTATKFSPEIIKKTYFKNDSALVSQFNGGPIIEERADITQEELNDPLLTPNLIKTKVLCSFTEYQILQQNLEDFRGFIRVYDDQFRMRKGFVQSMEYSPALGELDLVLEEKWESDFTDISFNGTVYLINEVGYGQDILPEPEYQAIDDYIQFFDSNTRPLTNKIRYDFVTVQGLSYDSMVELTDAIDGL